MELRLVGEGGWTKLVKGKVLGEPYHPLYNSVDLGGWAIVWFEEEEFPESSKLLCCVLTCNPLPKKIHTGYYPARTCAARGKVIALSLFVCKTISHFHWEKLLFKLQYDRVAWRFMVKGHHIIHILVKFFLDWDGVSWGSWGASMINMNHSRRITWPVEGRGSLCSLLARVWRRSESS